MYELCVRSGHYDDALKVFVEHEELRKTLWRPRYTPVSFSLLMTAAAEPGPNAEGATPRRMLADSAAPACRARWECACALTRHVAWRSADREIATYPRAHGQVWRTPAHRGV